MRDPCGITCGVCRNREVRSVATLRSEIDGNEYTAMACDRCDLVFAHPLPDLSFERLQDVYDAEYTASQREVDAETETSRSLRDATHRQMEIVERHVPKGAVLNVGAMSSASAVIAERGWIDTDNALGLRTQVELAVRRVLGEKLAASLVGKLTGKNLRTRYGRLIPPVHLYCFSERNMTRLLESAGLEVAEVYKPAWGDPTWFPLGGRAGMGAAERAFLALDQLGARFGRGEVIAILARKP